MGVVAFLFLPIVFGPLGLIFGAIGLSKKESKAVVAMVVSGVGFLVGMILGAVLFSL